MTLLCKSAAGVAGARGVSDVGGRRRQAEPPVSNGKLAVGKRRQHGVGSATDNLGRGSARLGPWPGGYKRVTPNDSSGGAVGGNTGLTVMVGGICDGTEDSR